MWFFSVSVAGNRFARFIGLVYCESDWCDSHQSCLCFVCLFSCWQGSFCPVLVSSCLLSVFLICFLFVFVCFRSVLFACGESVYLPLSLLNMECVLFFLHVLAFVVFIFFVVLFACFIFPVGSGVLFFVLLFCVAIFFCKGAFLFCMFGIFITCRTASWLSAVLFPVVLLYCLCAFVIPCWLSFLFVSCFILPVGFLSCLFLVLFCLLAFFFSLPVVRCCFSLAVLPTCVACCVAWLPHFLFCFVCLYFSRVCFFSCL